MNATKLLEWRAGPQVQWLKLPAWKVAGAKTTLAFKFQRNKVFLPRSLVKIQYCGNLRDREVACSTSDRQGLNFAFCVWRAVSSHTSHPQEILLAQLSIFVHKGGLKPHSFHFIFVRMNSTRESFLWKLLLPEILLEFSLWVGGIFRNSYRKLFRMKHAR